MKEYFVDLHAHIGRNSEGKKVKVAGARDLTFENIAREAAKRKGIEIVGVIDCASPRVLSDIDRLVRAGEMVELPGGGLRYLDQVTVIAGAEVEAPCPAGGTAHCLSFFPTLTQVRAFSREMAGHIRNMNLSTQRANMGARELAAATRRHDGLFVVAHAFTPHRSLYGTCARRLSDVFLGQERELVDGVELGLSADTDMADRIAELRDYTFLSNSDAHSLPKLGREYNVMLLEEASFREVALALSRRAGRRVVANFGLDPRLGKYHLTACEDCGARFSVAASPRVCPECGSVRLVIGVSDRIAEIADTERPVHPDHRPPYQHQVPLEFVPGVGSATMDRLIDAFGTEMAILHRAGLEDLSEVVGPLLAERIVLAREGELRVAAGGGGTYGKAVVAEES
ncbi:MAG: endonuclease Q family protein [Firmicutes bacterium]|nr:endonuclease Q family protein [Bacillota bacterium]